MNYWLVKSEPSVYSWDQLKKDKVTGWDGVRNYAARNNLREMKKNDLVFFYHSNEGLAIVGVAKVGKEAYQDPTTDNANWVAVDLKPVRALKHPVPLALIRTIPALAEMELVVNSRLSVQKVSPAQWELILRISEGK